jgi:hypothetical protein
MSGESRRAMLRFSELPGEFPLAVILPQSALEERRGRAIRRMRGRKSAARKSFRAIPRLAKISRVWPGNWALIGNNSATRPGQRRRRPSYLFSGSGCRAATTPPRAAAERLGRNTRLNRQWTRIHAKDQLACIGVNSRLRSLVGGHASLDRYRPSRVQPGRPAHRSEAGRGICPAGA